jgi:hypothetical protein
MVKGVLLPVTSSMENRSAPPLLVSLATSCQSFEGKEPELLVSWNLMRRLFS